MLSDNVPRKQLPFFLCLRYVEVKLKNVLEITIIAIAKTLNININFTKINAPETIMNYGVMRTLALFITEMR